MGEGRRLIIVGAGGHGRVVLDAARASGWEVVGFIDPHRPVDSLVNGCRVLGGDEMIGGPRGVGDVELIVALGDQSLRRKLAKRVEEAGRALAHVVHPSAIVSDHAAIARGAMVLARAVINANARIGAHAIVNTGAIVEHDCELADNVKVGPGATLAAGVVVEVDSLIGAGAVVIPGVRLGAGSVLGAGAVAIRDIPAGAVAVGVPARVVSRA